VGGLLVLTVLAYVPALRAGFVWDDDVLVTTNDLLHGWRGLADIWLRPGSTFQYYPLTFTSWWAQYHAWGLAAVGYHVVNVLLHGTSAAVLWLLLLRLGVPGAWTAAAVFALHPVHVESVAWVSELKNVQSGFFYLVAALAALRWLGLGGAKPAVGWRAYGVMLVCFLAAVLSKTVTVTLPVVLALILWWRRGTIERTQMLGLLPLLALGLAAGALTVSMERNYVGAIGGEWALSLPERVLVAGRAPWFYLAKLVWPSRLSFVYPRWTLDPSAWWQWLFPLGAVAVLAALVVFRGRLGRAPLVAALYFLVTLAPALGFFDVYPMRYSFVADHFQYLASLGPIVALVALAARVLAGRPRARVVLSAILLTALGALAWRQALAYRNPETLWHDTLAKNPSAMIAHNNLGTELLGQERRREAREEFEEAIRLARGTSAWEPHNNLGRVLMQEGQLAEAAAHFQEAVRLADGAGLRRQPAVCVIHNNLGLVFLNQGRVADAAVEFQRALDVQPDYTDALYNLGNAHAIEGNLDAAEADFTRVLQLDERHATAHNSLGNVLALRGRRDEAIRHYQRALEIDPGYADARANLEVVRAR
jgi:protein O-mannosyl-transferase